MLVSPVSRFPPTPPRGVCVSALCVCVSVSANKIIYAIFSSFHIYALIYDREKNLNSLLKQIPSPVFMTIW